MAAVALAEGPAPRRLRVGVAADARWQPRWLVEALAAVGNSECAEIVAMSALPGAPARASWLARAYGALDQWAFGAELSDPVDLAEAFAHLQIDSGTWPVPDFSEELDVVFALGAIDDEALRKLARYGVWRLDFDGFGEVAAGEPSSASALTVRLPHGGAPRLAYRSWARTYSLSVARNRRQLAQKTAEFALRALRELHRTGPAWLERCAVATPQRKKSRALAPSLARIGGRIAVRAAQKALCIEQWHLAFRFGTHEVSGGLEEFTRIVPPRGRHWADPFAIEKNGRYYVFFEEFPLAEGKAHIAMLELKSSGRWSSPVRVLERDYHLSYPFLLEHDGELYMIPESAQNRTVEIYRCVDFPLRWRLERRLLEGVRLVDPTLHRAGGRWWMFANGACGESRVFDDELHLFHASNPLGAWQPHERNPVRSDVRSARPAGALFERHGVLYRPAQVCVPRYGAGIAVQRVHRLTPYEYAERQVQRLLPTAGGELLGLHTMNRVRGLTVVDGFTRRRRF